MPTPPEAPSIRTWPDWIVQRREALKGGDAATGWPLPASKDSLLACVPAYLQWHRRIGKPTQAFSPNMPAEQSAEDLVAWPKLSDLSANRFDSPCDIGSEDLEYLGASRPPVRKRPTSGPVIVPESSGFTDAAQIFTRSFIHRRATGVAYFLEMQYFRRSVSGANNGFHERPRYYELMTLALRSASSTR